VTAAVELRGVSAGFDGVPVLDDVSLTLAERGYLGIIGPNGGGKTTLLKVILGVHAPSQGEVLIHGEPVSTGRHRVGYVPQYPRVDLDFPISVADVVLMGRRARRGLAPWWKGSDREAALRALADVGMESHLRARIGDLSGGQRQRVFIARALVAEPSILLLDEPTASVDTAAQGHVYDLLARLNEAMAIVLVTHDIGIISSHVQQVACLNRQLYTHGDRSLTPEMVEQAYQCPVDLIAHGVPHRVLADHPHEQSHGHVCDHACERARSPHREG
jgi:zinc transport system ATP-binding protein